MNRRLCARETCKRRLRFERLEERRVLAPVTVSNASDVVDGITDNGIAALIANPGTDGKISFREAILAANSGQGHDTITFSTNPADGLDGGTIFLSLALGELAITDSVTIDASMLEDGLTIDAGGGLDGEVGNGDGIRIFNITGSSTMLVTMKNLTLTGGDVSGPGGAINSTASLDIQDCTITGNHAKESSGGGGGVFSTGKIFKLTNSTVSGNEASGGSDGGGLFLRPNVTGLPFPLIEIQQSRITNNTVSELNATNGLADFGGMYIDARFTYDGQITISDTVISGNKALGIESNMGGLGIRMGRGQLAIERSTISGNHADDDVGGIYLRLNGTTATITNTLVSGNTAGFNGYFGFPGPTDAGAGAYFILESAGHNTTLIVESSTISGNIGESNSNNDGDGGGVGIYARYGAAVAFRNSTISENSTDGGGGAVSIRGSGNVTFEHSTIYGNRSDSDGDGVADQGTASGGGLRIDGSATVTLSHTIVAQNYSGIGVNETPNDLNIGQFTPITVSWSLIVHIGNLLGHIDPYTQQEDFHEAPVGSPDANGNLIGGPINGLIDPRLGPLTYNGGRTPTHALLPNSPAINAGNPSIANPPAYDQRGNPWDRVETVGNRIDIGAFEWQPNPLPGDYNFDGVVDAADYTVWRNTLGSMIDLRADGNGNGMIDVGDYDVWKSNYGQPMADASANGVTDFADHLIWLATYGSTTDLRADYNEDGIVDDADYEIWFDTYGSTMEVAQFGLLSSMFGADAPPAVVGVALGLPGVGAMDFAGKVGSGEQVRSVPLIAANTLNITFSRDVNITAGALELVNLDGASPTLFGFSYDPLAQTATWTFQTSLADGRYLARLSDSVEDLDGRALDGEFFNPWSLDATGTSVFPSGDGDEGGEFRFRFTVLSGDSDRDNIDGATDYTNWQSTEPGMIIVTTTADEFDADLSFGDVSLREAVHYANTAGAPMSIQLLPGRYTLSRTGTETTPAVAWNDLDITGDVTIIGAGPGVSIIDNSGLGSSSHARTFEINGAASRLKLSRLTVANGSTSMANVAVVTAGATLEISDSAIVNHVAYAGAAAVQITNANLVVSRSVFTNNDNTSIYGGTAILVAGSTSAPSSISVGESIFALNTQPIYNGGTANRAIWITGPTTKENRGRNLYDYADGGFFDTTPGVDDYLGTPDFVVTSVADTFNHADNLEALSLREAVDLANNATGPAEIWLPAWRFGLTIGRGANATDTDVAYGDLDVKNSLTIRGIKDRTSVAWAAGIVDKVFDLLGDFNDDGSVDAADYTVWQNQNGSSGGLEQFSADGDDDGDVDYDDYLVWHSNYGHTLQLLDIGL